MENNKNDDSGTVIVSDITEEGFWLKTPIKEYYISRDKYPWFKDATDEEIKHVIFLPEAGEGHVNMLIWLTLGIDFDEVSIERPEVIYHAIRVRKVLRPDLFKGKVRVNE